MASRHLFIVCTLIAGSLLAGGHDRVAAQSGGVATAFVYRHAGQPAAGVRIIQRLNDGEELVALTDGDGRATLTPRARVRIEDPAADDVVLDGFTVGATTPARVLVPEAVRLSGKIASEAVGTLRLQYGFGRRVTARQRFRRDYDRDAAKTPPEETQLFGLAIPKSPHAWRQISVKPDGSFLTPWFAGADDPQLLATTAAGRVAVEDVALTGATPRATIAAPALRFVQTKTLAVDVRGQRKKVATDVEVYLRGARWRDDDAAFVARYLAVLDRIDVRTFTFASAIRAYVIGLGASNIPWLPPFSDVDLRLMGAVMGPQADVTVPVPDTSARLALNARQVLPEHTNTLALTGTVVFERTYAPAENATVVYSCFPDKVETRTDRFGNFVIPAACVDKESTLFVTTTDTASPAQFAPAQKTQTLVHRTGDVKPVVIVLPFKPLAVAGRAAPVLPPGPDLRASTLRNARKLWVPHHEPIRNSAFWPLLRSRPAPPDAAFRTLGQDNGDGAPRVLVYQDAMDGEEYNNVVNAAWVDREQAILAVEVSEPGNWRVRVEESICFVGENTSVDFTENRTQVMKISLIDQQLYNLYLTVFYPGGLNLPVDAGVPVYFPSYIEEPDPGEEETNRNGVVTFATCDLNAVNVFIAAEGVGYFNDAVTLYWQQGGTITLAAEPPWDEGLTQTVPGAVPGGGAASAPASGAGPTSGPASGSGNGSGQGSSAGSAPGSAPGSPAGPAAPPRHF